MPDAPQPRIGYIVVNPGYDPAAEPTSSWTLMTLPEARAYRAQSRRIGSPRTVILKTTTTYESVEDGDHD